MEVEIIEVSVITLFFKDLLKRLFNKVNRLLEIIKVLSKQNNGIPSSKSG